MNMTLHFKMFDFSLLKKGNVMSLEERAKATIRNANVTFSIERSLNVNLSRSSDISAILFQFLS